MCGHFTTMQKSRITWIILINIWALFRILHTLILEFPLYCLYCNFLYQSPFFFFPLQIIPTMVIHVIVACFLVLLLDFSFGRRVYHMPLGRLKCSRLGGTKLSWEQNESSKKKMRKCASFRGHFWLC